MNPVVLLKALLLAGVFAVVGTWAFTKVGTSAGKVKSAFR